MSAPFTTTPSRRAQQWAAYFSEPRRPIKATPFVRAKKRISSVDSMADQIFNDCGPGSPQAWESEEIDRFLKLPTPGGAAARRRGAVLHDWLRSDDNGTGGRTIAHELANPLTATGLEKMVTGSTTEADRRLIYIADLDPHYLFALGRTAMSHEMHIFRDAVAKHLLFKSSVKVEISTIGYKTFKLELQLPYLALRRCTPETQPRHVSIKPMRKKLDLSFLLDSCCAGGGTRSEKQHLVDCCNTIHEVHFTLVICGLDEKGYVTYAFDELAFQGEELEVEGGDEIVEGLEEEEADREDEAGKVEEDDDGKVAAEATDMCVPREDPIVGPDLHGNPHEFLDTPTESAREYYLKVYDQRVRRAADEADRIGHVVTRAVQKYLETHESASLLSNRVGTMKDRQRAAKESYDWVTKVTTLLNKLLDNLGMSLRSWDQFKGNGHIEVFQDARPPPLPAGLSHGSGINGGSYGSAATAADDKMFVFLEGIAASYEKMREVQYTLVSLQERCKNYEKSLELRLQVEAIELAENNGFIAKFGIQLIQPVGLAIALFCMPGHVLPFELSFRSFTIVAAVFVVLVQLLFPICATVLCLPWWQMQIQAWMKRQKLEAAAPVQGGERRDGEAEVEGSSWSRIFRGRSGGPSQETSDEEARGGTM